MLKTIDKEIIAKMQNELKKTNLSLNQATSTNPANELLKMISVPEGNIDRFYK